MSDVSRLPVWPLQRAGAAIAALAAHLGTIEPENRSVPDAPALPADRWLPAAAAHMGLDADPVDGWADDTEELLRRAAPGLALAPVGALVVVRATRRAAVLLGPDQRTHRVPMSAVTAALCASALDSIGPETDELLRTTGTTDEGTRQAVLRSRLRAVWLTGVWALRPGPGTPLRSAARTARLIPTVAGFACAELLAYTVFVASWAVLGRAALSGQVEGGALVTWASLLALSVALRLVASWQEGALGISAGRVLRQRVLIGALRLDPDEIRHQGAGQLTGRVLESQVVEDVAVSGGLLAGLAVVELGIALVVLTRGAAPIALPALLGAWIAASALLAWRYFHASRTWTECRLALTDRVVELVAGHRTRLAQCRPGLWHQGEDDALSSYERASRRLDGFRIGLLVVVARGWVLTSLVVLSVSGGTQAGFAVALGGVLLSFHALERTSLALTQLADVGVAGRQMASFLTAAARLPSRPGMPGGSVKAPTSESLLTGLALRYRHAGRDEAVLEGCDVEVPARARILLEGPSGAGKSTLAAVMAGLRQPTDGRLELGGRRVHQVGVHEWRRRGQPLAAVPREPPHARLARVQPPPRTRSATVTR